MLSTTSAGSAKAVRGKRPCCSRAKPKVRRGGPHARLGGSAGPGGLQPAESPGVACWFGATCAGVLLERMRLHLGTQRFLAARRGDRIWEASCDYAALSLERLGARLRPEMFRAPLFPKTPRNHRDCTRRRLHRRRSAVAQVVPVCGRPEALAMRGAVRNRTRHRDAAENPRVPRRMNNAGKTRATVKPRTLSGNRKGCGTRHGHSTAVVARLFRASQRPAPFAGRGGGGGVRRSWKSPAPRRTIRDRSEDAGYSKSSRPTAGRLRPAKQTAARGGR